MTRGEVLKYREKFFWIIIRCSLVGHFSLPEDTCCFHQVVHLTSAMNLEAIPTSEALSVHPYTARWCKEKSKLRPIYRAERNRGTLLLLLLLLLSSSSSSSTSPLCRVFIRIFLRQTMSPGNTVLQLFCCYYSRCLYRKFQCWIYCTFTLVLSEVCLQCPMWLYYYYYYYYYYYSCIISGTNSVIL